MCDMRHHVRRHDCAPADISARAEIKSINATDTTIDYYTRPWMLDLLVTATSRLSRTLRFTIFLGLVQWNQQFHAMFPRWYVVLGRRFKYAMPLKAALTLVSLPSALRFSEWALKPTGLNKGTGGSVLLPGVPHTVIDNSLVMAWIALFLLAAVVLLQLPTAELIAAGYRKEIFSDADTWCRHTVRFKGMLVFMTFAPFFRARPPPPPSRQLPPRPPPPSASHPRALARARQHPRLAPPFVRRSSPQQLHLVMATSRAQV